MSAIEPPHGPVKRGFPWVLVAFPVGGIVLFLGLWWYLSPSERKVPVAYTDFVADVHAGRVEEIVIHDRDIRYRTRPIDGRPGVVKEAVGPTPDQRMLDTLKPDDPSAPMPKVTLEK